MTGFADLIHPLSPDEFCDTILDRQFLHLMHGSGPGRSTLFDLAELDHLLSRPALAANTVFAIDARKTLGPADYSLPDGSCDVLRVLDLVEGGATLVVREADRHHPGLWRLTRAFERALQAPAFANVYYAPAGGQSFPTHYDALDVFAVQLAGRKIWNLYPPIAAKPLRHDHCYDDLGNPGEPVQVTLNTGDLLYIPRGMPHLVTAADEWSLHISISVTPFTHFDLMRGHLDALATRDGDHRAACSPLHAPRRDLVAAIQLPDDQELDRMRRAALLAQVPVAVDQPLRARATARSLDADSRLIAVNAAPYFIETPGDHVQLLGNGRALGFTLQAAEALKLALSGQAFAVRELPGLDNDEARCDLAATLLINGFVQTA